MIDTAAIVRGLTPELAVEVQALVERCNQFESLDFPLAFEPPPADAPDQANQLVYRTDGTTVGFACLTDDMTPEGWIAVDPAFRRRGIGRHLLQAINDEVRRRGMPRWLLTLDEASPSGRAFVAALGAELAFAEYSMVLDPHALDRSRPRQDRLRLRPAAPGDSDTIASITTAAFGDPLEATRARVVAGMAELNQRYFVAELGTKPIGTLRVSQHEPHMYITAFGVDPAYQGRGYGRQLLGDIVQMLLREKQASIRIEVETENRNALGLYRSVGFREQQVYGYYTIRTTATNTSGED